VVSRNGGTSRAPLPDGSGIVGGRLVGAGLLVWVADGLFAVSGSCLEEQRLFGCLDRRDRYRVPATVPAMDRSSSRATAGGTPTTTPASSQRQRGETLLAVVLVLGVASAGDRHVGLVRRHLQAASPASCSPGGRGPLRRCS
jgi:hypothetical protein